MASAIDATKPVTGNPTTQSVRDNFNIAKSEITALQAITAGGLVSKTGDTMTGKLVINSNTAAPVASGANTVLQINGSDSGGNAGLEIDSFGAGLGFSAITLRHSGGTGAAPAATPSGSSLGQLQGRGYGATGWSGNRSSLNFIATENWDDTHQGVNITINATPTGGTATATVATFQSGMQLGAPAGGDLGAGSLNMSGQLQVNQNAASPTFTSTEVGRFVAADSAACVVGLYAFSGAVGGQATGLNLHKKRGTAAAPTATQLNDSIGFLTWSNFDGTNEHQVATIQCLAAENTTSTNAGGLVNFLTAAIGQTALTTRMQIGGLGGVIVGAPTGGDLGPGTLNQAGKHQINFNAAAAPAPAFGGNLVVHGVDATVASIEMVTYGANPAIPRFLGRHAGGTGAAPAATPAGANLGSYGAGGYDTAWKTASGSVQFVSAEAGAWTASANGTNCVILTTPIGTTAVAACATFLSGVQIGAPTGGDKGAGTLNATGVYAAGVLLTSDAAIKTDIAPLPQCLGMVEAIEPKRFKFRDPGPTPSGDPDMASTPSGPPGWYDKPRWGFVAQDVERVMQGHDFGGIETGADGMRSLSHSDLLAVLWQAVRELAELKGKATPKRKAN